MPSSRRCPADRRPEGGEATSTARAYYYAGSQRVATRLGSALPHYLLGDNLGSTAITADTNGAKVAELRYKAWGENRHFLLAQLQPWCRSCLAEMGLKHPTDCATGGIVLCIISCLGPQVAALLLIQRLHV